MGFAGARVIALDWGVKRIGLAVSDALGWTAQGLPTLERRNWTVDLARLRQLAERYRIGTWVLGLPLHMSGSEGRQAARVREFGGKLQAATQVPVEYLDERLTTAEASRVLRQAQSSRSQQRRSVDRLAAVILLQHYLDRRRAASGQQLDGGG